MRGYFNFWRDSWASTRSKMANLHVVNSWHEMKCDSAQRAHGETVLAANIAMTDDSN